MKIYFVRHAESTSDIEDRYGGDYDDPLTEKGREQAISLGLELSDKGVETIYYSPRIRTKETAFIANKHMNSNLVEVNNLRERNNYGILTGLTKKEGKEKYPFEASKVKGNKMFHDILESESYEDFKSRVENCLKEILKQNKSDKIAIFSHGGFMFVLVRELLKQGEVTYDDCAYIELEYKNNNFKVLDKVRCEFNKGV